MIVISSPPLDTANTTPIPDGAATRSPSVRLDTANKNNNWSVIKYITLVPKLIKKTQKVKDIFTCSA